MATGLLAVWAAGWALALTRRGGGSWHFFVTGGRVLADLDDGSRAGLHVYAEHPVLQIGPVALGIAWALGRISGGNGLLAAQVIGVVTGVVVVLVGARLEAPLLRRPGVENGRRPTPYVWGAIACFTPVWLFVGISSAHLDDVLALTFSVVGLALALGDRPAWAGLALAVAVDCKPWALPMVVVLLSLPSARRRAVALGVAATGIIAAWLPFFVVDPNTLRAVHYTIANSPLSGLHLFDPGDARTPTWDRPLQTVIGAALAGAAVWRGRLTGSLLLVMAGRLALDPGSNRYYAAGLAAGALLWDLTGSRHRIPIWSLVVVIGLHFARWVPALDPVHGPALVAFAAAAAVEVLGSRSREGRLPTDLGTGWRVGITRSRRATLVPRGDRTPYVEGAGEDHGPGDAHGIAGEDVRDEVDAERNP